MRSRILMLLAVACLALQACGEASPNSGPQPVGGEAPAGSREPFVPFADVAAIQLLTPASGAGAKPLFEWEPVLSAARYSLLLQFSDGQPYWAWGGSETSVYLGGAHSQPAAEAAGPLLQAGMTWSVVAFDAQNNVIAASARQPISP